MGIISIIGSGFSGAMIAVHALRASQTATVTLIERSGRCGPGVAYGTPCDDHVLNVPAGRMSAYPEDQDHFLKWAQVKMPGVLGGSFLPRSMYGNYISEQLQHAGGAAGNRLRIITAEATDITCSANTSGASKAQVKIQMPSSGHEWIEADHVVLALGNFAPVDPPIADPSFYLSNRYIRDPWGPSARRGVSGSFAGDVLLIGTGLTMLDIALELAKDPSVGTIHAISRRGLLPQPHRAAGKPATYDPPSAIKDWKPTALGMLKGLRQEIREEAAEGIDWREVVTSIRPVTQQLWKRLSMEERARFLRHVRPYWEVARHRSAPQPSAAIQELIRAERVVIHCGRLLNARALSDRAVIQYRPRGSTKTVELVIARVINCTGPDSDCTRLKEPLIQSLRESGMIRPDPLGLGLDSTDEGAIVDAHGNIGGVLWLAGPLRKATHWEETAVPELREHAQWLGRRLADC